MSFCKTYGGFAVTAVLSLILSARFATVARAADYIESVSGDLSGDGQAPTPLSFNFGPNTISGTMGRPSGGSVDADIFAVTLGAGQFLNSIVVNSLTPQGENSFFAISSGPTINQSDPATHLSNILVDAPDEYFDDLAFPAYGGPGITGPLGPGTYTIWLQETSQVRDYSFTYTVVVPEPAAVGSAALVAGLLSRVRVRRRRDAQVRTRGT